MSSLTMLLGAKVKCPACQRFNCRGSKWHSRQEKLAHGGFRPYRCQDCSHRFLARPNAGLAEKRLVFLPVVIAFLVVSIAATYLVTRPESAPGQGASASDPLYGPELRKAAERGDAEAQFRLGEALFHEPARTGENSRDAIRWLQASAENGNTEAMVFLGRLSRTGVGILQDFAQAFNWVQTAAARGSPEGMLELGRLYRDGVGVERDLMRAYAWFNRAAAVRNLDAVRERDAIARNLTTEELKRAQKLSAELQREMGASPSGPKPKS